MEKKIRKREKKKVNPIRKIGFSPISKTVLIMNALILILILATIKSFVKFIFTGKIQTNYSKHLKEAIKVWQSS